jgi:diguanylate cyclase (GGDEF)-like protein
MDRGLGHGPTRVLLIEDSPHDARSIRSMLESQPFELTHVSRVGSALDRLNNGGAGADVVLLDLMLPDATGLDGLGRVQRAAPDKPIIILTHMDDEPTAVSALNRGAQDYLIKSRLDGPTLSREIRYAIERHRFGRALQQATLELRQTNATLEHLVLLDPLTELLNRRGLQRVLSREVQGIRREGSDLLAILIDIDNFKTVNDTLGYAVGDVVLKEIARKMKKALRVTDSVARIGGDEFLILLPNTRRAEGLRVAEKVRLALSGSPVELPSKPLHVTVSVGVVSVSNATPSIDELLSQTHRVLSLSKRAGKNRVSCEWSPEDPGAGEGDPLSVVLRDLRSGDRLRTIFQPIYNLEDEREIGYEALTRLTAGSFEMPDDFFRLSLEANILTLVDHRCFKRGLAAASELPASVRRHLNVFPSTLIDIPVQHLLHEFPGDETRGKFCIEISEQQIIGDPSYLAEPVRGFREAGILVAIDDVGYGRSCLESMVMLEPDLVKIDKTCVKGISTDGSRARSLKRLLRVAGSLGADTIAEGIECREDLEVLRELGVKAGQGYLWGVPA